MSNLPSMTCQPPGFYIDLELQARGWSQEDLAYILGMDRSSVSKIIKGVKPISVDNAILLADAFFGMDAMDAEFFTNLENQFRLSQAKQAPPSVKVKAKWQSAFPIREMLKRGWIEEDDPSLFDIQMLRFFEKNDLNDVPFLEGNSFTSVTGFAAKQSKVETPKPEQVAWLYRVRQIAKTLDVPKYSKEKLINSLDSLRALMASTDDVADVPSILTECGVRFLIVEALPKAKIDGVCTWLDNGQPVVAITNRYNRLDNFWFVLRHELEHVIHGHGLDNGFSSIDNFDEISDEIEEEERIANEAASDFCVPKLQMDSFIARKGPYISEKDMLGLARRLQVHPAIVVGQLQRRLDRYNLFRKYLSSDVAGVRGVLLTEASQNKWNIVDGWEINASTQL